MGTQNQIQVKITDEQEAMKQYLKDRAINISKLTTNALEERAKAEGWPPEGGDQ